jgi:hypothetical protein
LLINRFNWTDQLETPQFSIILHFHCRFKSVILSRLDFTIFELDLMIKWFSQFCRFKSSDISSITSAGEDYRRF